MYITGAALLGSKQAAAYFVSSKLFGSTGFASRIHMLLSISICLELGRTDMPLLQNLQG